LTETLRVAVLTHGGYGAAAVVQEFVRRGRAPVAVVAETESRPKPKAGSPRKKRKGPLALLRAKTLELGPWQGAGFVLGRFGDRALRVVGLGSPDPFGFRFLRAAEKMWLRVLHCTLYGYPPGAYDPSERRLWSADEICRERGIPYHRVRSLNSTEARAILEALQADVFVLAGTRVLKPATLRLARKVVLNKHSSLLPAYRGLKGEFWALYHGDLDRLGITIHEVDPGLDTGPILLQEHLPFRKYDSHVSLRVRSQDLGARLLVDAVERMEKEPTWRGTPQAAGDWPTYTAPTIEQLREYRTRLKGLWKRTDSRESRPQQDGERARGR